MKQLPLMIVLLAISTTSIAQCLKPITPKMPNIENLRPEAMEQLEIEMARYMRDNETYMACEMDENKYEQAALLMRKIMLQYNDTVRAYNNKPAS